MLILLVLCNHAFKWTNWEFEVNERKCLVTTLFANRVNCMHICEHVKNQEHKIFYKTNFDSFVRYFH